MYPDTCPTPADLAAFARGDLPVAELDAVTAHLDACPVCEQAVDAVDTTDDPVIAALRTPLALPARLPTTVSFDSRRDTAEAPARSFPVRLGGYEVLGEVGRGGMGVVYKGWDPRLKRYAALKVIRAGAHATPGEAVRFRREAEAIARVRHPNLVQVYEVGYHDGLPFLSLEYVPGGSLDRRLDGSPRAAAAAARLVATLAEAVQAAHDCGIIHRDLKPSNILLADAPGASELIPKITDFGLAKWVDGPDGMTGSGAIAGTPDYMAPEQAAGRSALAGPPADVYSLGVILYELIVGRPPFRGESAADTLFQVVNADPVPPSRLRPRVPRDLETVCLKCLQKDPRRRYPTARDLADDLGRFLADQPVRARRAGPAERLARACRRNPLPAVLAALVIASLVVGTVTASYYAVRADRNAATARENEEKAVKAKEAANGLKDAADAAKAAAVAASSETKRNLYYAQMHLAGQARHYNRALTRMVGLLSPWGPAASSVRPGWEWYYLDSLSRTEHVLLPHGQGVTGVVWGHRGNRLATIGRDGRVGVWGSDTGTLLADLSATPAAFCAAWSPDDAFLATGGTDGVVRVWRADDWSQAGAYLPRGEPIIAVAWTATGEVLAVGPGKATVRACSPASEAAGQAIETGLTGVLTADFSPDASRLAAGASNRLTVYDLAERKVVTEVILAVRALAWSPDGTRLAVGKTDHTIDLVDAATGRWQATLRGHRHIVTAVKWSADGQVVYSCGLDHAVHVWDAHDGRLLHTLLGHTDEVYAVAAGPGDRVASGSADRTVRVWSARQPVVPVGATLSSVSWSGDSTRVAVTTSDGQLRVFERATLREANPPARFPTDAVTTAWSPQGQLVACGGRDGTVRVVDARDGAVTCTLKGQSLPTTAVAWHPDGKRLAVIGIEPGLRVWDLPAGRSPVVLGGKDTIFQSVAWSPDGRHLAAASPGRLFVWAADASWATTTTIDVGPTAVNRLAWHPDSHRLAGGDRAGHIRVWDLGAATATLDMSLTRDMVRGLSWAPDGRRIASATVGGVALIWDAESGALAFTLEADNDLADVAWSPDGEALAGVTSPGGALHLWDAAASYEHHHSPQRLNELKPADRLAALIDRGREADALAFLESAKSVCSPALVADAYHRLADRRRAAGRVADADQALDLARRAYERALEVDPADDRRARRLADLLLDATQGWVILRTVAATSVGGATLTALPDGSILASGVNPPEDEYRVVARTDLAAIAAVRLEALPDPSLPQCGTGRYPGNGNFLLSTLRVSVGPAGQGEAGATPVALTAAAADFELPGAGAAGNVLDARPETAWDTFPRNREPRWLVARAAAPATAGPGATVVTTLEFRPRTWPQHALGRFRLSASANPRAHLAAIVQAKWPSPAGDQCRLAAARYLSGDPAAAVRLLSRQDQEPVGPHGWLVLALAHHDLGAADRAREYHQRAVEWMSRSASDTVVRELAVEAAIRIDGADPAAARAATDQLVADGEFAALAAADRGADPAPWLARGRKLASEGHWAAAAREYREALRRGPAGFEDWYWAAILLLHVGDDVGYRGACDELLQRAEKSQVPKDLERAVKAAILRPSDTALARIVKLADAAKSAKPSESYIQLAKALSDYRSDQFAAAEPVLARLAEEGKHWNITIPASFILAMTHYRLGQADVARAVLDRGVMLHDKTFANGRSPHARHLWPDYLICLLLRREAETVLAMSPAGIVPP